MLRAARSTMAASIAGSLMLLLPAIHALPIGGERISRPALLRSVGCSVAASLVAPASSQAYDLPPLDAFDDKTLRAKYAAMPNPPLDKQASAAFFAITSGDLASLKMMIQSGWDLGSATDSAGKTSLHRAAQLGNAGAVQLLLDGGFKVDPTTRWAETPLHFAIRNGRLNVVKQLKEAGADTSKETFGGDNALALAQKYRMVSVAEYLSSP